MDGDVVYTPFERLWLVVLAAATLCGLNGVFVYALLWRRDLLDQALQNPVAAAFMAEALLMVGALAYLLRRWRVARLPWGWFIVLSLLGGVAFALPVAVLWGGRGLRSNRS